MTDPDLDRVLAALKKEDGAPLGSVSARVMAQIDSESRRRWWTAAGWALAAAAAAVLAVYLTIPQAPAIPQNNDRPALVVTTPVVPRFELASHRPPKHAAPLRTAIARHQTLKAAPLEIRMQTDDPDVLIIWLVDGEEEGHL